jgi:transposase InsO family protein
MDERRRFIEDHAHRLYDMTELAARYGISRKTGYKWLARFAELGRSGLGNRSHAPHHCPHRIPRAVAELIVAARRAHPSWGPRKLLDWLEPKYPEVEFPAASTAGDLLARRGLVKKRRRRRKHTHPGVVPAVTHEPNDLWTTDFKGQFKTRDGIYCYPLTVADQHTRYLLACQGLLSIHGWRVRPVFERLFREYGLPRAIRTDNGAPFANTGLHGLTQLNVWWMRLGIVHQRIRPAHPQENGCHERMHRTLKYEATKPPKQNRAAQQRRFQTFRVEYNTERPHEALGGKAPSVLYAPSPRAYPTKLPALEYPGHFLVKPVTAAGTFRFKRKVLFIANALQHHAIGLEEVADGVWSIYLGNVLLGRLDERTYVIHG